MRIVNREKDKSRRRSVLPRLGILGCLGVATCVAGYHGGWRWVQAKNNARYPLRVPAEKLHFGTQWAQRDFKWTLPVTNVSRGPLTIAFFRGSCDCVAIEPKSVTIPPNETRELVVSIALLPKLTTDWQEVERDVVLEVTPFGNGTAPIQESWYLQGVAQCAVVPKSGAVRIATALDSLSRGSEFEEVQLRAHSLVSAIDATCSSKVVDATTRRVNERGDWVLRLTTKDRVVQGSQDCEVRLTARDRRGRSLEGPSVWVHIQSVGDVYANPSAIMWQRQSDEESTQKTITLASRSGSRFRITRVISDFAQMPKEILLDGSSLVPTEYASLHAVTVRLNGHRDESSERTLTFVIELEQDLGKQVHVPLSIKLLNKTSRKRR